LATYIVAVARAPLTLWLWERHGWAVVVVLTTAAALVDYLTLTFDIDFLRWVNYLSVWNALHALGYAWADGRIGRPRSRMILGLCSLGVLALLVAVFVYPLAMVGHDG